MVFSFASCDDDASEKVKTSTLVVSEKAYDNAKTVLGSIKGVYNKEELKNNYSTVEQVKEYVPDFEYYVEIGTTDLKSIDKITIGSQEFKKEDEVKLSIGNNGFIKDVVFKVENGKLMVAAVPLIIEMAENPVIKINEETFKIDTFENVKQLELVEATWQTGSSNTAKISEDKKAVASVIKDTTATKWLGFKFKDIGADALYLTKKATLDYGLTPSESNGALGFYALGWNTTGLPTDITKCNRKYDAYCFEKAGYISLTLTFTKGE